MAEHHLKGEFNVGTGTAYSFDTVVDLLKEELATDVEREYVENPIPSDVYVYDTCADPTAFQEATGWEPSIDLRGGSAGCADRISIDDPTAVVGSSRCRPR